MKRFGLPTLILLWMTGSRQCLSRNHRLICKQNYSVSPYQLLVSKLTHGVSFLYFHPLLVEVESTLDIWAHSNMDIWDGSTVGLSAHLIAESSTNGHFGFVSAYTVWIPLCLHGYGSDLSFEWAKLLGRGCSLCLIARSLQYVAVGIQHLRHHCTSRKQTTNIISLERFWWCFV